VIAKQAMLGGLMISIAAAAPDPAVLRATLPDAIDSTWIEAAPGAVGYIDGPVDATVLRAYYEHFQQSESWIQGELDRLQREGFVGGYERQWYRARSRDLLGENVMVFATTAGAKSENDTLKADDARRPDFVSYFDPQLNPGSTGTILGATGGYHWAFVSFIKGDALYGVSIGSDTTVKAEDVLPQARRVFDAAPPNIRLPRETSPGSVLARNPLLFAIAGLWLLLAIALIVSVATIVLLLPHRRFVPNPGTEVRT
jgi:hypothetical protein